MSMAYRLVIWGAAAPFVLCCAGSGKTLFMGFPAGAFYARIVTEKLIILK